MIFRALNFACKAHEGQYRKGTNIPYIAHLTNVMKTLCQYNCSQEVIVAGILHDVVEDTPTPIELIELKFGSRVAEIVNFLTEKTFYTKNKRTWKERKIEKTQKLEQTEDVDILMVISADKLDNIGDMVQDYLALGDNFWKRFNAPKDDILNYQEQTINILLNKGKKFGPPLSILTQKLFDEFDSFKKILNN